jgi:hypothetical protein
MAMLQGLIQKLNGEEDEPLPGGMPGTPGNPNTGIAGASPLVPSAEPVPGGMPPSPQQAAAPPAQDYGRLMGYDPAKLNDPNRHSFKYDTARVMSQFDPKQGFTPDVINALNQLDYGTFSGGGDKLSLSGAKNAKDAADFANQDWIYAHKAQNDDTKWNFGGGGAAPQEAPQQAAPRGGGMPIAPLLHGDPSANISAALGQVGGAQDDSLIQRLIAQLQQGAQ